MRKTVTTTILSLFLLPLFAGCDPRQAEEKGVQAQQSQYREAQPVPYFDYSLERDVAIQLYKARNEEVTTHTVWRSDTGVIEGDCPSIGYPLPYDTSLTNPLEYVANGGVVEMAEPNGLYSSKNSISTWVRCVVNVSDKDVIAPIYIESKVTAYPYPVLVDYDKGRVLPINSKPPTVTIESK